MQFVFGSYTLDPDRRELTRGSETIALGPRVFDLLLYLVQNSERVVSKRELLHTIWGGRVVSESTMTSHVNAVRNAIGDNGSEQRLVRTVARKGFRFVADVRVGDRFGSDWYSRSGCPWLEWTACACTDHSWPTVDCYPAVPEPECRSRAGARRGRRGRRH